MKILLRQIDCYELPSKILFLFLVILRTIYFFREPYRILIQYIMKPELRFRKTVRLRKGYTIHFSSHNQDLLTVIEIFCKKDYGKIPKDGVLIDIGANIGIYSLYAALNGARKVYAIEPNREAYNILMKNVSENHFEKIIVPINLAVTAIADDQVMIPVKSHRQNRIRANFGEENYEGYEPVKTISLKGIFKKYSVDHVELMKIDCEGSEYDILLKSDPVLYENISEIRIEYHEGSTSTIASHLRKFDFRVIKFKPETSQMGHMWLSKHVEGSLRSDTKWI